MTQEYTREAMDRIGELLARVEEPGLEVHYQHQVKLEDITRLPMLGIFRDNWRMRTIFYYGDSSALLVTKMAWSVGVWDSAPKITLAYEPVSRTVAIAADYWQHGRKVYEYD